MVTHNRLDQKVADWKARGKPVESSSSPTASDAGNQTLNRQKCPKCLDAAWVGVGCRYTWGHNAETGEREKSLAEAIPLEPGQMEFQFIDAHPGYQWYFTYASCECELERKAAARRAQAEDTVTALEKQIPAMYRGFSFETFDTLPAEAIEGKEAARMVAYTFGLGQSAGAFIIGPRGRGKTALLTSALRMRATDGMRCGWRGWTALLRNIRGTYHDDADTSEDVILEELIAYDCLLIDDFGPAQEGGDVTAFAKRIAWDLIGERYNHLKPTAITSNMTYDWLHENFDPRLMERINQVCEVIEIKDSSMNLRTGKAR